MRHKKTITTTLFLLPGYLLAEAALPDPTRPSDYVEKSEVIEVFEIEEIPKQFIDWKVTAIRISDKQRTAIINGQLVKSGDEIGPAKVLEIKPVSVLLDYDDKSFVVRLFKDSTNKKFRTD